MPDLAVNAMKELTVYDVTRGANNSNNDAPHMIQTRFRKMDNRDIDLLVPETTRRSLADADQLDLEEKDVSEVPQLTVEYVTYIGASYCAFVEVFRSELMCAY